MADNGLNIDDLQIQISVDAANAVSAIVKLSKSLQSLSETHIDTRPLRGFVEELEELSKNNKGLLELSRNLNEISKAASKFSVKGLAADMASNIKNFGSAEDALYRVENVNGSKISKGMSSLADSIKILDGVGRDIPGIKDIATNIWAIADAGSRLNGVSAAIRQVASALNKTAESANTAGSSASSAGDAIEGAADKTGDLTTESSEAEVQVERTSRSLKDLIASLKGVLSHPIKGFRSLITGIKQTGDEAEKSKGKIGGFLGMVKRVALMRAIRSALRLLVQGLKEGIQNLVEWDYAWGNNTSGAYQTMTELKSLANQVKNTFGAMAMPIIQIVTPAIRLATQALMALANIVNQIARAFQGYGTYMKAVYVEVAAVTDETNNAKHAVKELQKVLFGFDELNVLPSKNGTGGGTGVLNNLGSPIQFEEVASNSKITAVVEWIKQAYRDVAEWLNNNVFKPIATAVEWLDKQIVTFFNDPIGIIQNAWSSVTTWFKEKITDPVGGFFSALGKTVALVVEYMTHPSKWFAGTFDEELKAIWDKVFKDTKAGIENTNRYLDSNPLAPSLEEPKLDPEPIYKDIKHTNNQLKTLKIEPKVTNPKIETGEITSKVDSTNKWLKGNPLVLETKNPTADTSGVTNKVTETNKWLALHPMMPLLNALDGKPILNDAETLVKQGQDYLNKNRLLFKFGLNTNGFSTSVANVWGTMQNTLSGTNFAVPIVGKQGSIDGSDVNAKLRKIQAVAFASGGVPDTGTLFYAGEAGAEVVANMGHNTGVMNMSQMQEAVASGNMDVVNAIYTAINTITREIRDKDSNVYISQDAIGRAATNYQYNQGRRGVAY